MRVVLFLITTLAIAGQFTTSIGDANTYLVSAIATDAAGNTYVVGSRQLAGIAESVAIIGDFSSVATAPPVIDGPSDVFVSKLDPNGKLLFTDTFAGKGVDTGTSIALDPTGNIYIAGTTTSPDFPLSKPLISQPSSFGTGFIVKLSNDGSTILYSTYFGGTLGETGITALATDANGNLYLTGLTNASDFPHTPGIPFGQIQLGASNVISGAIIASISAAGDKILYSGAIVGTLPTPLECSTITLCEINTGGVGIAVDAAGNAYIAGNTGATNLATTAGVLSPTGSGAFVAKVNPGGTALSYLTYLTPSQSAATTLNAVAVDAAGNAYLAGETIDESFPVTPGSYQPTYSPAYPQSFFLAFVAKLNPSASAVVWGTYLNGGGGDTARSIAVVANGAASGNVWVTGTTLPGMANTNGWTTGPEFVAEDFVLGLNAAGSKLTYSALYPIGTVGQSVAVDPFGLVHVAGMNGLISAIAPTTAPSMTIFGFQNAFGGGVNARISPAEVISIFGPGIGPATAATATPTNGVYPTTLSGVQVAINGVDMPLLYVSANQINAVVPMAIAPNAAATVHVVNGTTVSPDYPVWIAPSEPVALPTVINQDGTINSQANPSKGGSIVTFYATGWQSSFSPLTDGQVATTAEDVCHGTCQVSPTPGVYAPQATVLYGGAAPGIVAGVSQFNVQIGAVAMSNFAMQFSFSLTGPSSVAQTVWIAY
jgi:uncharacterized protein (TIGR03437 family)